MFNFVSSKNNKLENSQIAGVVIDSHNTVNSNNINNSHNTTNSYNTTASNNQVAQELESIQKQLEDIIYDLKEIHKEIEDGKKKIAFAISGNGRSL